MAVLSTQILPLCGTEGKEPFFISFATVRAFGADRPEFRNVEHLRRVAAIGRAGDDRRAVAPGQFFFVVFHERVGEPQRFRHPLIGELHDGQFELASSIVLSIMPATVFDANMHPSSISIPMKVENPSLRLFRIVSRNHSARNIAAARDSA
jgi:hypothetical protein